MKDKNLELIKQFDNNIKLMESYMKKYNKYKQSINSFKEISTKRELTKKENVVLKTIVIKLENINKLVNELNKQIKNS